MTMLGATDGEDGHGYLEIAEWLAANSADAAYYRLTRKEASARYSEMKAAVGPLS